MPVRGARGQPEPFITGSVRAPIPADQLPATIGQLPDLSWLGAEVAGLHCADKGRACMDPEIAMCLMLAGFLPGIVHDRRLVHEAQGDLAIRRVIGCAVHEALPDPSAPTRIRQRRDGGNLRRVAARVLQQGRGRASIIDPVDR